MATIHPTAFEDYCHVCFDCFSLCVKHDPKLREWIEMGKTTEGFVFIEELPQEAYTSNHPCDCCQRSVKTRKIRAYTSFTRENFGIIPSKDLPLYK